MDWLKSLAPTIATALGGPLAGMAVSAVAARMSMVQKKPRKTARSQCKDTTANFDTHKAQESMHLERCHGAAAFIWMVSR